MGNKDDAGTNARLAAQWAAMDSDIAFAGQIYSAASAVLMPVGDYDAALGYQSKAYDVAVETGEFQRTVATVSSTGLVTITGEGYAEILAKATDGSGVAGCCRVDGASGIDGIIAPDAEVDVYTLQGTHVYSGRLADAHLAAGMYLVRQGVEVFKTFVR